MLSNKALLVYVSISQWTGRKKDKEATRTVAKTHETDSQAGNYTKKLLPGSKELNRVSTISNNIREYFYLNSLPWFSDGARIIKSESYMHFANEFSKMRSEYYQAVNDFLNVYAYLRDNAKGSLGSLYKSEDYPDVATLKQRFKCEVNVMPLPDVKDFRVDIGEDEKRKFLETIQRVETQAMQDCWTRLYGVVQKAAEKLATPDYRIHDSLIENISEMCDLLTRLNITDDPELELARAKVQVTISKFNPDKLRGNAIERQDAAHKLAEITKTMGAFMGGD